MLIQLTPGIVAPDYAEATLPMALVKAHLRIDSDDEDALIELYRGAAIELIEALGDLRLGPVEGEVATFPAFGANMIIGRGKREPMTVTGVDYTDADGVEVQLASGAWRLSGMGALQPAVGDSWPDGASNVRVAIDRGYASCPAELRTAALMMISTFYADREQAMAGATSGDVPGGVMQITRRWSQTWA